MRSTAVGALFLSLGCFAAEPCHAAEATIPFTACAATLHGLPGSDRAPPSGGGKIIDLGPAIAGALAFYQSEYDPGLVAPRGWDCFNATGSSGGVLMIAPTRSDLQPLIDQHVKPVVSPAIALRSFDGGASGRFSVVSYAMRYFPHEETDFVQAVIDEGLVTKEALTLPPFLDDAVTYKGPRLLEFSTPADRDGLGTHAGLAKSGLPIYGMVALTGSGANGGVGVTMLQVRLPPDLIYLRPTIIEYVERCVVAGVGAAPPPQCAKDPPK